MFFCAGQGVIMSHVVFDNNESNVINNKTLNHLTVTLCMYGVLPDFFQY